MRYLIGVVIIIAILLGVQQLQKTWNEMKSKQPGPEAGAYDAQAESAEPSPAVEALTGVPPHLEPSLENARRQGPDSLKRWLDTNRRSVQDPRLAAIELDYVVAVAGKDFGAAREVFAAVKARTPTNSPIYSRLKRLERSYQ